MQKMQIRIFKDSETVGRVAAQVFANHITVNPKAVLGFATGSSPLPTYANIVKLNKEGLIDCSEIRTFNLDEYVGLEPSHPCSYDRFMRENLFDALGLSKDQTSLPLGTAADLNAECERYENSIDQAGGIDLQILGIGHNGHIAFNEPDDNFSAVTHVVNLTESTIEANKRFFDSAADVPRQAISTGIGTIFKARNIIMVVTGADKAQAVRDMVKGEINPACPASVLQLHSNTTILLDAAAASLL